MLVGLALAVAAPLCADPVSAPPAAAAEVQPGGAERRVLARPRQTAEPADQRDARLETAERSRGLPPRRVFQHAGRIRVLTVPAGRSVEEAVAELQATGEYEFVEPDHRVYATTTPNDPHFGDGSQWDLNNTGQNSGLPGADISAPAGWSIRTSGALVAIIDSGALLTHEDLAANLWINPHIGSYGYTNDKYGIDAIANTGLNDATATPDGNGHGTHVAGTIGAVGNNSRGIAGVAWTTQLMILRFLPASGSGSLSDSIECINYAIHAGAKIINASYGSDTPSQSELTAIRAAGAAGIIFVAAAGNDTRNLDVGRSYPASYAADNLVAVAASTRLDDLASFSDYGSGAVELAAPGQDITSTYNTNTSSYAILSGTSMAAPHVVGVLSLMAAQYPTDNYRQLINRLLRSVDHKAAFAGKVHSGGRLNLATALANPSSRPFNDDFAERATLVGANVLARDANQFGTRETGEPNHAGQTGGASLWWTWTAPASGQVNIDTMQSSIDTLLAVYTGSAVNALTEVKSDDNSGGSGTSRLSFPAVAGTAYQIAVDGKNGATGLVMLNVGLIPANDSFAAPLDETGPSWAVTAANASASKEGGEPNHAGQTGGHSLWYRWTAPTSRVYAISVYTTDFDPVVAVYTGTTLNALTPVASNDNVVSGSKQSLATLNATAGQTYLIAVDGVSDTDTGQFTLSVIDSDWQYASTDVITSSPAVGTDGTVYVGTAAGWVVALEPNGFLKWIVSPARVDMASPAIAPDGTIYCGDNAGVMHAINPNDTEKWQYTAGGAIPSSPAIGTDGTIYFRADDNYLYALSPTSGGRIWSVNTGGVSYSSPSLAPDGTIYVGSDNNTLFAFNPNSTQKWAFTTNGGVYTSPAVGSDGTIYVGTLANRLYAVNANGTERWHYDAGGGITSSPVLGPNNTVYFGSYDGSLYALNSTTGALRWSYATGSEIRASAPVVAADGTVYIGSYDKRMHAVSSSGALIRTYSVGGIIRSSPVLAGGRLYFGCNDNKLYAIPVASGLATSDWPTFRQNPQHTGSASTPAISSQPINQSVAAGNNASFTVTATGAALTYQWQLSTNSGSTWANLTNDATYSGATTVSLSINGTTTGMSGNLFRCAITNSSGSATSNAATLTVSAVVSAPSITTQPSNLLVIVGNSASFTIAATGTTVTYQWQRSTNSGSTWSGLTNDSTYNGVTTVALTIDGTTTGMSGYQFRCVVTNSAGSATSNAATLTVTAAPATPTLLVQPASVSIGTGARVVFSVLASDASSMTYQWQRNGSDLAGATAATLALTSVSAGSAGTYTVVVRNGAGGSVVSSPATLSVSAQAYTPPGSTLINLSTRAQVGTGANIMIAGFVVGGSGAKQVLVRAVGPSLTTVGLTDTSILLANPKLQLTKLDGTPLAANDDWGNDAAIAAAGSAAGAFPLLSGSHDSALIVTLPPGLYTALVQGVSDTTGIALVELYDLDQPAASRLINLSTRAQVGTGAQAMFAGFVVSGAAPRQLLIRAIGPTLLNLGLTSGTLPDPQLTLTKLDGTPLATNDNWDATNGVAIAAAAQQAGAFTLAAGAKDSALLTSLTTGLYTPIITDRTGTTGLALVEVYEVP